uniref:Putative TonB-dependent receptor family protein n=1 Tax=termite gut metagenome TaxID=433724 RepID=S0DE25_9ZZZZ
MDNLYKTDGHRRINRLANRCFLVVAMLAFAMQSFAQSPTVATGTVTDESGSPVAGVMVSLVSNPARVDITNTDGNFRLDGVANGDFLRFTHLSYVSQDVAFFGQPLAVTLETNAEAIDDVVVVAYGTQRKSSITGSIASVNVDKMKDITSPSVASMLQGKVAGVSVLPTSGQPGSAPSIRIRGTGSIRGIQDPLWVVDGVVGASSTNLNPNDIEAISILKDGSATALYGSRGANGVVLVSTKRGATGTSRVDVSVKLGVSTLQRGNLRMVDGAEYYDYLVTAFTNQGNLAGQHFMQPYLRERTTDWWKYSTQNALSQNYNLAYTYGSDKIRAYISGDYYTEEGTYKGYNYDRFTVRANTDYIVNKRLTLKSKIALGYRETFSQQYPNVYYSYTPWDTARNSKGELKTGSEGMPTADDAPTADPSDYWYSDGAYNSFYNLPLNWSRTRRSTIDAGLGFDFKIFDFLTFESNNNFYFAHQDGVTYNDPKSLGAAGQAVNGTISNSFPNDRSIYASQLLRFLKTFKDVHEVSAYLGYDYDEGIAWTANASATNMIIGNEVLSGGAEDHKVSGGKTEERNAAYFFNGNYAYDGKYLLDASFRYDGSSRFGANKRWAPFWSIGAGWNMHREEFMKSARFIDQLKLRVSYGIAGNLPSSAYAWSTKFNTTMQYGDEVAFYSNYAGNKDLAWEQTNVFNAGLDLRLFDRVSIVLDVYSKKVKNLIYLKHLSAVTGYNRQDANDGKLENSGVEFTITGDIIKTKNVFWDVSFNIGYNQNKITYMPDGDDLSMNAVAVGYPYLNWYMREWAGVDSQTGQGLWFNVTDELDKDGNKTGKKIKTATTDYNSATPVLMNASPAPKINGGISTSFAWKGLSLDASFTFSAGAWIYNSSRAGALDRDAERPSQPPMRLAKGWSRWEKPGDIATHPQLGVNTASSSSTRYLERGDFFKMKTLAISYSLPKRWLEPIGLKDLSVSVGGENLFTITDYSGIDPEVLLSSSYNGSGSTGAYATVRRFTVGLNLKF